MKTHVAALLTLHLAVNSVGCCTGSNASNEAPASSQESTTTPILPPPTAPLEARVVEEGARAGSEASAVADHVREGRRAAREGNHAAAVEAFDLALASAPQNPRLHCEAGWIEHQRGDDEKATRRINLALRLYTSQIALATVPLDPAAPITALTTHLADVPEPLRVPIAICLFNRGVLAETSDPTLARQAFEASLQLRPNRIVRTRAEALGVRTTAPRARLERMGGVRFEASGHNFTLHTEAWRDVSAFLVAQHNQDVDVDELGEASVELLGAVDLPLDPERHLNDAEMEAQADQADAWIFQTSTPDYQLSTQAWYLAFRANHTIHVVLIGTGNSDESDNGSIGGDGLTIEAFERHGDWFWITTTDMSESEENTPSSDESCDACWEEGELVTSQRSILFVNQSSAVHEFVLVPHHVERARSERHLEDDTVIDLLTDPTSTSWIRTVVARTPSTPPYTCEVAFSAPESIRITSQTGTISPEFAWATVGAERAIRELPVHSWH